ncbi:MAG: hypothetical protein VX809_05250 [Pseudomonadota bacterium]|nr:hypothetical protein [Pseudomonadota bacterium]
MGDPRPPTYTSPVAASTTGSRNELFIVLTDVCVLTDVYAGGMTCLFLA